MRKALTLTASPYFLGICASYFGLFAPVGAQDPQTLFGSDKAPPAAALPKAGGSAKKVPAAKPAVATPAKAAAAPAKAAAAPVKAAAAAQSKTAGAAPAKPAAEQQAKAASMAPSKPSAGHAKAHAKPAAVQAEPDSATATAAPSSTDAMAPASTAEPSEPAKAEGNTLTKTGTKASVKAAPKAHSTAAAGPRPGPGRGPRVSGPPPASPAQVRNYCGKLWNKIQNNWDLATGKNHVILGVDVDASGNVTGTQASSQPKNADAETKAQAALTKSQPLEALPTGLPTAHLTITFDSTADPHGDSNSGGSVRLEYNPGASSGATIPVNSPAPSAPASSTTSQ